MDALRKKINQIRQEKDEAVDRAEEAERKAKLAESDVEKVSPHFVAAIYKLMCMFIPSKIVTFLLSTVG